MKQESSKTEKSLMQKGSKSIQALNRVEEINTTHFLYKQFGFDLENENVYHKNKTSILR